MAQPHVQTEGSPASQHGLSSGPTPPAAGVGPSAGARPATPGGIPRHPCIPVGKPNPRGLWAFRRHPPGGGMPAELGLSPNSGDPPPARLGPPSLSYSRDKQGEAGAGAGCLFPLWTSLRVGVLGPRGRRGRGVAGAGGPPQELPLAPGHAAGVEGPVLKGSASGLRCPVCGCCFSIGRPRDTFEPSSFKC